MLLDFYPIKYLSKIFPHEVTVQEIYKEIFLSEEWLMLDRGVITEEEAINKICSRSTKNGDHIKLVMGKWYDILTPNEATVSVLKRLKDKGHKIYYLSNFHMLAFKEVTKRYEFFKYFDGGVVSYEEKLLKPEEEIYKKLIARYSIHPKDSVFIDDTLVNIQEAKRLGFAVIHFKNATDLKDL